MVAGTDAKQRLIYADAVEKVLTDLYIKRSLDSDRWVLVDVEKGIRELPIIEAIPIEYLEKKRAECYPGSERELFLRWLINEWKG